MIKNIFITGSIQIGKSTLINNFINDYGIRVSGYKTLPYFIGSVENRKGFYFHSLVDTDPYMNDVPISVQYRKEDCIRVQETFKTLGVHTLRRSIEDTSELIVLDELGRIERDISEFINEVHNVLNSKKMVVGVIKKCDEKWLDDIKQREDVLVYDLDTMSYKEIYLKLSNLLKKCNR